MRSLIEVNFPRGEEMCYSGPQEVLDQPPLQSLSPETLQHRAYRQQQKGWHTTCRTVGQYFWEQQLRKGFRQEVRLVFYFSHSFGFVLRWGWEQRGGI